MQETGNNSFSKTNFTTVNTDEIKISIQAGLDGFSFSAIRLDDNRLLNFLALPVQISSEKFLAERFAEWVQSIESGFTWAAVTCLILNSEKFMLVPESLLDEKKAPLLNLVFDGYVSEKRVGIQKLQQLNASLIFNIPAGIRELTREGGFKGSIEHLAGSCLFHAINHDSPDLMFIAFGRSDFIIAVKNKGKLMLLNRYRFAHQNDIAYYLLTIVKTFGLNSKNIPVKIAGEIMAGDHKFELIRRAFPACSFYYPENGLKTPGDFPSSMLFRYFTIFTEN
jgi:hypothetical protein